MMILQIALAGVLMVMASSTPSSLAVEAESANPPNLSAALSDALNGTLPTANVEVFVSCWNERGFREAQIFGRGLGIWNRRGQFALSSPQVTRSLEFLKEMKFTDMPETFGGSVIPDGERMGVRVTCRVSLEIGEHARTVLQLEKGTQSEELNRLANSILDVVEEPARRMITAANLRDGLDKLEAGVLAPETFVLLIHQAADGQARGENTEGWLLRVEGLEVSVQKMLDSGEYSEARRWRLAAPEFLRLIQSLKANDAADLPVNLYSSRYTDLRLGVLQWERTIQARAFARMTPQTHGESQLRFDQILELLRGLYGRAGN